MGVTSGEKKNSPSRETGCFEATRLETTSLHGSRDGCGVCQVGSLQVQWSRAAHSATLDWRRSFIDGLRFDGDDDDRDRGRGRGGFDLDMDTTDFTSDDFGGDTLFEEPAHVLLVVVLGLEPEVELDDGD